MEREKAKEERKATMNKHFRSEVFVHRVRTMPASVCTLLLTRNTSSPFWIVGFDKKCPQPRMVGEVHTLAGGSLDLHHVI